jgi:hypothetical protein
MSPGTKVICVDASIKPEAFISVIECFQYWVEENKVYTVREFLENDGIVPGILLEEITNKPIMIKLLGRKQEPAFGLFRFRELTEAELEEELMLEEAAPELIQVETNLIY